MSDSAATTEPSVSGSNSGSNSGSEEAETTSPPAPKRQKKKQQQPKREAAAAAAVDGAENTEQSSGSKQCSNASSSLNILIRHHGKIPFARPIVLEWSPLPVATSSGIQPGTVTAAAAAATTQSSAAAAAAAKNADKYQYLRVPASEDIVIKPLTYKIVDLRFGLQFSNTRTTQNCQWSVHNWEPLLLEGLVIHHANPLQHNVKLLMQNCSERVIEIKQGDPLAVIRFSPLPKKLQLNYIPLVN